MLAAVVQLNSQDDVAANLRRAGELVQQAARAGAELVVLPENFAFMGAEDEKRRIAEEIGGARHGPIVAALAEMAAAHGLFVVGGGMPEKSGDPARPYNASVVVDPRGAVVATYRKIHLFDVALADGTKLEESASTSPGALDAVTADLGALTLGLSVCYDVRFPELYRRLGALGARAISVPAAFTVTTGKDHWHVLLRARAIENQVYVLAPAQHGKHPRNRQTYGKSLICDPWGDVVAQVPDGEGFAVAPLDLARQDAVRAGLPSLAHRRM